MGENSKIEYADTWNPWLGCEPVHTGCLNCYAQAYFKRYGIVGKRRRTSDANWKKPLTWNRKAEPNPFLHSYEIERPRVLLSLCDPFEDWDGPIVDSTGRQIFRQRDGIADPLTMTDLRRDMFGVIDQCQNLDWLLATKRPENIRPMWPFDALRAPDSLPYDEPKRLDNAWLLYSASDQESLEAGIDSLLGCRNLVPVLGLSLEPLIGPIILRPEWLELLSWLIVGGESSPKRRPMKLEWLAAVVDQCKRAGIPCFVKQDCAPKPGQQGRIPDELWKIKQFPEVNHV